ncbi:RHS repeat-associated core domain-containing protein [Pseudomonas sp. NPDC089408]|uniref:RHS repeat-associated core domain-containing protein n=1 Tax=Pseudomonas sp. NPDC089408 TaxID=3364465 RepID=UPI0037FB4B32
MSSTTRKYFYGRKGFSTLVSADDCLSCMRFETGLSAIRLSTGLTRIIGSDAQGSVLSEIESAACAHRCFTVYGLAAPRPVKDIGFKGERCDRLMQCYPLGNGYRTYSPVLMRFYSADNQSPFGKGGLNAYAFVKGDPVNLSDPSGHSPNAGKGGGFYYRGPIKVIEGMRVFFSQDASGTRVLNIGAHGVAGRIGSQRVNHPARTVVQTLQKHGYAMNGQETHILACNSANGTPSFIQDMANITQAPSTGYQGSLWTDDNRPAMINGSMDNYWVKLIKTMAADDSDYARFAYAPVTVKPAVAARKLSDEPKDLATKLRQ